MSYTSLAQSAVDWALSKVGCAYSQAQRTQENIFDCSSLVARAYSAQGKRWKYGGSVPTSNKEIYDDDFELLWPATYPPCQETFGLKKCEQESPLSPVHHTAPFQIPRT